MSAPTVLAWGEVRGVGGTESRMAEVIAYWRGQGRRIVSVVLAEDDDSPFYRLLTSSGSEVHRAGSVRKLAEVVRHEQPGLVIAFGLRASLLVRAVRLMAQLHRQSWPYTVDARNGLEMNRSWLLWRVDRWTQRLVDLFVANSEAAAETLTRHGLAPHRVRIVHSALGEVWQGSIGEPAPEPRSIVMVGTARPEKQQQLGLEVFARLRHQATLTIFTNDARALRKCWDQLATTARGTVCFREGHSVNPQDLAKAAIMLHPSRSESAPRCLMEGRASGCYVVAFDVGDTRRIVNDGGTLVPPGDADALLVALEAALERSATGTLPHRRAHFPSVPEYAAALGTIGGQP